MSWIIIMMQTIIFYILFHRVCNSSLAADNEKVSLVIVLTTNPMKKIKTNNGSF